MAREILFRGLNSDTKKWEYGFFYRTVANQHHLITEKQSQVVRIDIETIGQYTGWKASEVKIFDGDKIQDPGDSEYIGVVFYDESKAAWCVDYGDGGIEMFADYISLDGYDVIGNIHDK